MSEPIRSQIDGLSEQLFNQHNALMDKLDTLIDAFQAPIDYSANFAQIAGLLVEVRDGLGTALLPGDPINYYLPAVLTALGNLNTTLGTVNTRVQSTNTFLSAIRTSLGPLQGGDYQDVTTITGAILTYMANVSSNTQGLGGTWAADVIAELNCICEGTRALAPADPTDPTLEGYCSDPWVSTGQVVLPWVLIGGTSQMFAVFDVLPTGLSYGSTFSLTDDHTELDAVDWTGWRVFVQSDQPQYADGGDLLGVARYPTNQWNPLTGTNPRAFSVDARGSIKVYLCSPESDGAPTIPEGECHTFGVTGTDGDAYIVEVPNYPANYTLRVPSPAHIMDSTETDHFVNYGIDWTQEDVGPGPWTVKIGDNRFDAPSTAYVTVCNPGS